MPLTLLLKITALIEAVTGIALILQPNTVAGLLLGQALSGGGPAVARLAGIALLALAVMAWASRETLGRSPALAAMMTYNVAAAIYLAMLVIEGALVGKLLLPAVVLHAALGLLLVHGWWSANDRKL
jgi:hypothetical protein